MTLLETHFCSCRARGHKGAAANPGAHEEACGALRRYRRAAWPPAAFVARYHPGLELGEAAHEVIEAEFPWLGDACLLGAIWRATPHEALDDGTEVVVEPRRGKNRPGLILLGRGQRIESIERRTTGREDELFNRQELPLASGPLSAHLGRTGLALRPRAAKRLESLAPWLLEPEAFRRAYGLAPVVAGPKSAGMSYRYFAHPDPQQPGVILGMAGVSVALVVAAGETPWAQAVAEEQMAITTLHERLAEASERVPLYRNDPALSGLPLAQTLLLGRRTALLLMISKHAQQRLAERAPKLLQPRALVTALAETWVLGHVRGGGATMLLLVRDGAGRFGQDQLWVLIGRVLVTVYEADHPELVAVLSGISRETRKRRALLRTQQAGGTLDLSTEPALCPAALLRRVCVD